MLANSTTGQHQRAEVFISFANVRFATAKKLHSRPSFHEDSWLRLAAQGHQHEYKGIVGIVHPQS